MSKRRKPKKSASIAIPSSSTSGSINTTNSNGMAFENPMMQCHGTHGSDLTGRRTRSRINNNSSRYNNSDVGTKIGSPTDFIMSPVSKMLNRRSKRIKKRLEREAAERQRTVAVDTSQTSHVIDKGKRSKSGGKAPKRRTRSRSKSRNDKGKK
eukprot:g259.t1